MLPVLTENSQKGRENIDKPQIDIEVQKAEERIVDTSAEHIREKMNCLRIENAF